MKKPTVNQTLEEVSERILGTGVLWPEVCAEFEKIFIAKALEKTHGSLNQAAELLGLHRNTLSKKVRLYGIDRMSWRNSDGNK